MAKKENNSPIVIRIPVPKPGNKHKDKSKYDRKPKYPKKVEE